MDKDDDGWSVPGLLERVRHIPLALFISMLAYSFVRDVIPAITNPTKTGAILVPIWTGSIVIIALLFGTLYSIAINIANLPTDKYVRDGCFILAGVSSALCLYFLIAL